MIPNIRAVAALAFDAEWEEGKHPRKDNGQFGSGGGGAMPQNAAVHKPVNVSSTLTGVFTSAGFKKQKQLGAGGTVVYYHPQSGAKVSVHPAPEGKKWSSKWSLSHPEKGEHKGEGSALAKLLDATVKKAEEKKAATAAPQKIKGSEISAYPSVSLANLGFLKVTNNNTGMNEYQNKAGDLLKLGQTGMWSIENIEGKVLKNGPTENELADYLQSSEKVASSSEHPDAKVADKWIDEQGYKTVDLQGPNANKAIYQKGAAKIQFDLDSGDWIASTPNHMTKEGNGLAKLQALFSGKVEAGVKNSQQTIMTKEEQQASAISAAKAQEAQKEAAAKSSKATTLYSKLKAHAPQPSATQQTAISKYSGSHYAHWNDQLRHDPNYASKNPDTKHLDDYLHSSTFPEEVVVRRGVSGEYAKILKSIIFEGTKFIDRGYVSTSAKEGWSWSGGLVFEITIPKGAKGAAIGKWSQHPAEMEVLLPRSSAFVVTHYDAAKNLVKVVLDQSHL